MFVRLLLLVFCLTFILSGITIAQGFYFGADQSYVNEMEDCGAVFQENGEVKDVYQIFADHGANLVRLRLWHSPAWYDSLNMGQRYSDLADVKKSIARAKGQEMAVLLDFHLSDFWADPSRQLVPNAWLDVVDDLPILQDSLYNYIYQTLEELAQQDLLPEMVQIGNETNKGIMLSPADNEGWILDWARNTALFNTAIQAVRDIEQNLDVDIQVALHLADPSDAEWLVDAFITNGVTDFDIIGMSYYWAWHQPTTIEEAGEVIQTFRSLYPEKEVMIFETGYIWTTQWNDDASNIISSTQEGYSPASPENQRDWLIDLTKEVMESGGSAVIYWEPSWVSTSCYTPWGQGSHQEHATFFNFDNHLLLPGGIEWMSYDYDGITRSEEVLQAVPVRIITYSFNGAAKIFIEAGQPKDYLVQVSDKTGQILHRATITEATTELNLSTMPQGIYTITVFGPNGIKINRQLVYSDQ